MYKIDNETMKKATCSCFVKVKLPLISEIKIDKAQLIANFKDFKNVANIKMLKCLHLFFDLKNIFKNSANYLFCFLFIMSFITVFTFFCNSYQKIKNKVKELNEINNSEEQKEEIILETNNIKDIKPKKKHRKGTKSFNNINNVFDSKNKMMGIKLKKNNKKKLK